MSQTLTEQDLSPANPLMQEATMKALKVRIEPGKVQEFVEKATSATVPPPIGATASVNLAIWGKFHCEPNDQPWVYDVTVWGGPMYFGSAVGVMYTAYDSWDAFFQNATSVWLQGIVSGGGFLQATWFNQDTIPVGQFNEPFRATTHARRVTVWNM